MLEFSKNAFEHTLERPFDISFRAPRFFFGRTALSAWITDRLVEWRWMLLALAVVLGVVSLPASVQLDFDRSVEAMFAADDPLLVPYRRLQQVFGGTEMILAVYTAPDLMTSEGADRLRTVGRRIQEVPGVAAVMTLLSPMGERVLDRSSPTARRCRELFEGYTHAADEKTAGVVVLLERSETNSRPGIVSRVRGIVEPLPDGAVVGEPVMVSDGFAYMEQDARRLGVWSTVLLSLTIAVCFRSVRWVLIPLVVVQLALITTRALLVACGVRLSMVSSMLTAIVTVLGVATVVHIVIRFRDAQRAGCSPQIALRRTGRIVAAPIFWACVTDAVGFAALLVADVGPIRDFGLMMATGALMVAVSAALVVPGLALMPPAGQLPPRSWGESRLSTGLARTLALVRRRPAVVGGVSLAVTAWGVAGCFMTEVETDFIRNFRRGTPLALGYERVEQQLGGAGVWDILMPAPRRLTWSFLAGVLDLEDDLRTQTTGLTKVLSIADGVQSLAPSDPARLPRFLQRTVTATALRGMKFRMPAFYESLYAVDNTGQPYYRVLLRSSERQSSERKKKLIEDVRRISRRHFPQAQVTGFFVLLASLIESVVRDQWKTFAVAAVGIVATMAIALQSIRLAVVATVPNVLPILLVTGLMGWFGQRINMGAAMIAAVSIGLSVDSSIHYITSFRRELRRRKEVDRALDAVQQTVGRAVVFSTLALIVGFSTLCWSQFVPTITFGVLVSLCMLGGLAGNLVMLPLLLRAASGRRPPTAIK